MAGPAIHYPGGGSVNTRYLFYVWGTITGPVLAGYYVKLRIQAGTQGEDLGPTHSSPIITLSTTDLQKRWSFWVRDLSAADYLLTVTLYSTGDVQVGDPDDVSVTLTEKIEMKSESRKR
jgi:hypothetical protein